MIKWGFYSLLGAYLVAISLALPSSLVQQIKNSEVKSNKVKRAQSDGNEPEENIGKMSYFTNRPTSAIKRGTNLKEADMGDWNRYPLFGDRDLSMDNVQSGLYDYPNLPLDDKTIAEYEKGYQYGTNKEKLDAALQNAILKSELYGDTYGPSMWPYEDSRRRKRETQTNKRNKLRYKRNIDLAPEEVLALLALYEKNKHELKGSELYQTDDNDDEAWLNNPIRYGTVDRVSENHLHQANSQPDYKPRWGAFDPATFKKKRLFY